MLILYARNIIKYYGERLILDVSEFKLYSGDRIGLIGTNGCGKSTFLNILTGKITPDSGSVKIETTWAYVRQFEPGDTDEYLSGGEITKARIFNATAGSPGLLFADEPTANMDSDAINKIEQIFKKLKGALVIVSHDRSFLDKMCNKIVKIKKGSLLEYEGNYSAYEKQTELDRLTAKNDYKKYTTEKEHLENSVSGMARAEGRIKKTPSRMGNSEARLHKRSSTEIKQHLAQHRKGMQSRLKKLEKKERPAKTEIPRIYHQGVNLPISKSALRLNLPMLQAGDKKLIEDVKIILPTGSKTAVTGPNGSGKTTLMKFIWEEREGVYIAPGSRVAYFSQKLDNMKDELSLIDNVTQNSTINRGIIRTVLASMLFSKTDITKKASVLSGGERVKLQLAAVLLSGADFLILDEVTNYLDITAIEALEKLMMEFPGTILFVSHDRRLVEKIADKVYRIKDGRLTEAMYEKQDENTPDANRVLIDIKIAELTLLLGRGDVVKERRENAEREISRLKELKKLTTEKTEN